MQAPPPTSASDYRQWTSQVRELGECIHQLEPAAREMGVSEARVGNWYGELFGKLLPQLDQDPFLVVAVMGGTNTGKSVVFNHLAGGRLSRAHPNATQTRHPVCCVPRGFALSQRVEQIFPGFEIEPWQSEDDALADGVVDRLFVREDPIGNQPSRLLLLDTPDVDGVLKENWRRADLVRHVADVLVCVLTQQKYNDAAVRDFFRAAAAADKPVLVVFNFVDWPRQRPLCDGWLKTFCAETGVDPIGIYAVANDPVAAEENRLEFHPLQPHSISPRQDLADLRFEETKIRTFRGSLHVVIDPQGGLPAWLLALDKRSADYALATDSLQRRFKIAIDDMPQLPKQLVWDEIWQWLDHRRTRFDRIVHGAFNAVFGIPARMLRSIRGSTGDTAVNLHAREWDSLQRALEQLLNQLEELRDEGNEILRTVMQRVLTGMNRQRLFDELKSRHAALPLISDDYRRFIQEELDKFQRENPRWMKLITGTLVTTAIARPMLTLGFASGVDVLAGHLVGHAMNIATEVAVDVGVGAASSEAVTAAARGAISSLLARIFARYYEDRAKVLTDLLQEKVLGDKLQWLSRLASVNQSEPFSRATQLVNLLGSQS